MIYVFHSVLTFLIFQIPFYNSGRHLPVQKPIIETEKYVKYIRGRSMTSFNVNQIKALFSTVSTVDFEQVRICWVNG